jgi:plasmid stabilization system protein ParE
VTAPLTLRPVARSEIEDAHRWYEEARPGLGEEFLQAVREVLAVIEEAPRRDGVIRGDVRRALLRRFPYSLLYLAEDRETVVLACFHASRDPKRWHERR